MTPDLLRPGGSAWNGTRFLGLTGLLGGSRASEAHWKKHRCNRQTMLAFFPPCVRTSTMQKLKEPFAPGSAARESLPWPVSVVYHGNQHDAANCLAAPLFRTTTLTSASQCADL